MLPVGTHPAHERLKARRDRLGMLTSAGQRHVLREMITRTLLVSLGRRGSRRREKAAAQSGGKD